MGDGAGLDWRGGLDIEVKLVEGFDNVVFRPGDDATSIGLLSLVRVDNGLGWWH